MSCMQSRRQAHLPSSNWSYRGAAGLSLCAHAAVDDGPVHCLLTSPVALQLGYRFAHVLRRMLPIAMFLLQRDGQFLNGHDLFLKRVGSAYHGFLEHAEKECRAKCLEDLQSTTRYVTWSLHTKSRASLKSMLNRVRMHSPRKAVQRMTTEIGEAQSRAPVEGRIRHTCTALQALHGDLCSHAWHMRV